MIESLFFPCASTPDEPVLKSIQFPPHKVDTVQEVCSFLKKLPVADKRYVNLHFYCKLLLSNYKPPVVPKNFFELKKMMLYWFECIEIVFVKTYSNKPFLNYGWLLRVLLEKFNLAEFKQFVKPLKCRKRVRFYEQTYTELETILRLRA